MLVYCDSVILIYYLESIGQFHQRALARMQALHVAGDQVVVSDLSRLECRVKPMRLGNTAAVAIFDQFFAHPDVLQASINGTVFERATGIRAHFRYSLPDSLHLAAAVEAGCNVFLTNDARLSAFTDLNVEILP